MCVRQHWLHGIALAKTTHHMLVACTGGVLPAHQLQADTISLAEQVLIGSWIPGPEDDPVAGKTCLKQHCRHDTDMLLTLITSLDAKTFASYHELGVLCLQMSACTHTLSLCSKQPALLRKDISSLRQAGKCYLAAGSHPRKCPQLQVRPF